MEIAMRFMEHQAEVVEHRQQTGSCMDCGVPFCQSGLLLGGMVSGCPLHNLIPEWNDLVDRGNWKLAYERLNKTHPLPEFTARVCPALCEAACTGHLRDGAVATKTTERLIIEKAFDNGWVIPMVPPIRTGKKVAVVGSGPAGLTAATMLNRRGHEVTVYERNDRVGGLLRYGIPNMKLDKKVLDRRIRLLEEEGVTFLTGKDVGKNLSAAALTAEYDRVILACGASKPRDISAPGRSAKGIYFAVDFLHQVTKSLLDSELRDQAFPSPENKDVVVIGGGDTGNDCIGTVIRLGAKSVTQLEMMPAAPIERAEDNPWPQWPKILKIDYGQADAITAFGSDPRIYNTTVTEFLSGPDNRLRQIKTVALKWEHDRASGRMQMQPIVGSEKILAAEMVLIAAGFLGAEEYVVEAFGVKPNGDGDVVAADSGCQTSRKKIYAAGDMRRGQSLVVWAIKEGVEVAKAVDRSLMGYTNL